jgi:hypothetical protein
VGRPGTTTMRFASWPSLVLTMLNCMVWIRLP